MHSYVHPHQSHASPPLPPSHVQPLQDDAEVDDSDPLGGQSLLKSSSSQITVPPSVRGALTTPPSSPQSAEDRIEEGANLQGSLLYAVSMNPSSVDASSSKTVVVPFVSAASATTIFVTERPSSTVSSSNASSRCGGATNIHKAATPQDIGSLNTSGATHDDVDLEGYEGREDTEDFSSPLGDEVDVDNFLLQVTPTLLLGGDGEDCDGAPAASGNYLCAVEYHHHMLEEDNAEGTDDLFETCDPLGGSGKREPSLSNHYIQNHAAGAGRGGHPQRNEMTIDSFLVNCHHVTVTDPAAFSLHASTHSIEAVSGAVSQRKVPGAMSFTASSSYYSCNSTCSSSGSFATSPSSLGSAAAHRLSRNLRSADRRGREHAVALAKPTLTGSICGEDDDDDDDETGADADEELTATQSSCGDTVSPATSPQAAPSDRQQQHHEPPHASMESALQRKNGQFARAKRRVSFNLDKK